MAVVLLQMGGPDTLDDLRPFLENLFQDPDIIQLPRILRPLQPWIARRIAKGRAPKMRPRYAEIGDGSPLRRETEDQARALERALEAEGRSGRVEVAMRYWHPRASEALARLPPDEPITLLTLYPHWSRATTASSVRDFLEAARAANHRGPIRMIDRWGEHPSYVALLRQQIQDEIAQIRKETDAPVHLLFTAHGLPQRYVDAGDPYPREVEATARLAAEGVGAEAWSLAYQSAVGPVEWLRPYTDEHLAKLAAEGTRAVVCVPLGFVSDHIETLYDIDITFAGIARANGRAWRRVPAFNGDPRFGRVLADILRDSAAVEATA